MVVATSTGLIFSCMTLLIKEPKRQESLITGIEQLNALKRVKYILGNGCFMWILIAGFARLFGSAYGFWSGSYFQSRFPDYSQEFSIIYAFGGICGSLFAELMGGLMGDHLETRFPKIKGLISCIGTLLAIPFLAVSFMFSKTFYLSALTLISNNFLGVWYGPTYTMINRIFSS